MSESLIVLFVTLTLMFFQAPRLLWMVAIATGLVLMTVLYVPPTWALITAWLLFIPLASIMLITRLRLRFFANPLLRLYLKIMPSMSDTEREALEAGTVWWEADIFSGKPDWKKMLGYPAPALSEDEQAFLDGPVNTVCGMIHDWEITEELRDLTPETWAYLKTNGFFGMIIPKQYGGLEFSANAHSAVVMKISSVSLSAGVTVMVPNSLGPAKLLLSYGTDEQKNHYLPRLADGREIPCFALTGPEAGSDAASMPDSGVVCRQTFEGQQDVLGIRLNWEKRYITLGPIATLLGLAFHLYDPDKLLGHKEDIGITLALIPTNTAGVEIGRRHFPMDQSFMNGPNRGKDVFIPMDWVIGGKSYVGQGWRMLMDSLSDGRAISLPALSTAAGKKMSRAVGAYSAIRKQFKVPIGKFEGVGEVLGRIAGTTYIMNAARGFTTAAIDSGEDPSVASAIIKYHLTERMRDVVNDAMDILGGRGICMGPSNFVARNYEALPIGITVEGANILTRNLIIFGQGAIRCHPWLYKEMEAAAGNNVEAFDEALLGHSSLAMSNMVRSLWHGITRGTFLSAPGSGETKNWYRQFARMSTAFAVTTEMTLMSLGGALKRKESLSARLGDVLSLLYLGSAVLKHHHDNGSPEEDLPMVEWACQDLLYKIQESLHQVLDNFPNRAIASLTTILTFPTGRHYKRPNDELTQLLAAGIMRQSEARDRLTDGIFNPTDPDEALTRLEDALAKETLAKPVLKKLRDAMRRGDLPHGDPEQCIEKGQETGIISQSETEFIKASIAARQLAIQVDDFLPQDLTKENRQWENDKTHGVGGQSI